jgi:hypothetical protein
MLNWILIAETSYLVGYGVFRVVDRLAGKTPTSIDRTLVVGGGLLTVYSEFFSLFADVSSGASFILLVLCLVILLVCRKDLKKQWIAVLELFQNRSMNRLSSDAVILLLFVFFLAVSAMQPSSYDDYLYHAQALEWIERYGVVPGLGNLHFRFAYNSAFLCLQALFSWKWLVGQSLHTVNALYAFLLSAYCVSSFSFLKSDENMQTSENVKSNAVFTVSGKAVLTSDLLKCVALVYLFYDTSVLSGLDTDPLAMMTVIYIFIKWAELTERQEKSGMPYALLGLLAVYACTLKLSCGAMVLLALYPLYIFIRGRQGRKIGFCVAAGVVILLPYLIRNVIISGYLLYPMNAIDLFSVDWKMPVYTLVEDRQGIQIWGRSLNGMLSEGKSWAEVAAMPFMQWFPVWFRSISHIQQLLFLLACAAMVDFLVHFVCHLIQRTKPDGQEFLLFVGIDCFIFWLLSAPLIRYGSLYMMIVVGCWIGVYHKKGSRALLYLWVILLAVELSHLPAGSMLRPADYASADHLLKQTIDAGTSADTAGTAGDGTEVDIYYPATGDQTDYQHFPSAPSSEAIGRVELRGNGLKDGFRSRSDQENR